MTLVNQMLFSYVAEKNAKVFPGKTYLVDETRRCTFKTFHERTNALARGLFSAGMRAGDRVAVLNHNAVENAEIFWGCMKAGVIAVPVNIRLAPPEIAQILEDADPALVITGLDYLPRLTSAWTPSPERIYVIQSGVPPHKSYGELIEGFSTDRVETDAGDEDVAMLIYTSGTTGKPKGVMWTHRNLFSSAQASAISRRTRPEDVALVAAPVYQAAGVATLFSSAYRGNTTVLINHFDPAEYLATIEREGVTTAFIVPAMLMKLMQSSEIDRRDLSSMRTICYGSAPMPIDLLKRAMNRFGWRFMGACGATETSSGYIAFLPDEDHLQDGSPVKERRLRSIGKESINAEVRIFDEQDRELPAGEVGEIVIRGTNIMKGYWRQPGETAEALRNGWYHTGDLGSIDEDGYIYIVDRKKDMIISGGFNIYPKEIETALDNHPSVLESAVVGLPDPQWGETPLAVVVLKKNTEPPGADGLMEFLREKLAGYKLPRGGIVFAGELPRNAAGKVLKRELRTLYCSKPARSEKGKTNTIPGAVENRPQES
ncbi:MAG: long-chain-fatty-acid--CoA ligase [Desulfobacteraceae bacterium]|nr:MAG: long-chain-fatty-acid--CoA ligase [Desulfobacteraceae bacterium]